MPQRAKCVRFRVSQIGAITPWIDIEAAEIAAGLYRVALQGAGDEWATEGPWLECSGPQRQHQNLAAGIYVGINAPSVAPPLGSELINYTGEYWFGPPGP